MKTFTFVWSFFAFSILGAEFLHNAETFVAHQDFESNFSLDNHPEEFLPGWSANEVRPTTARVFQAAGEGINNSRALGIQTTGNFNAEIYAKTTTYNLDNSRISLKAKTNKNGSGNRPVYVFYSFSVDEGNSFNFRGQLGNEESFTNENSPYRDYELSIPEELLGHESLWIKVEIQYGEGSGTASRLFLDDFTVHGLVKEEQDSLEIISIEVKEEKNLEVQFNQAIQFTGEHPQNSFILNHTYGSPEAIIMDGDRLLLQFSDYLYSNQYEISFSHLSPEAGEEIWMDKKFEFELITPTPPDKILINEFMPDPNPKGLIPEDPSLPSSAFNEYIELYNAADKPIGLKGFSYNDGIFEDFTLNPGAYVLLTPLEQKNSFASFGPVIGLKNFRGLTNAEGKISIKDALDNVVDSLSYTLEWYQDPEKTKGGWALERINPFQPCSDVANWMASTSPQGGTPGKINAVFDESPDTRPFFITKIQPVSSEEIKVGFSKPINEISIEEAIFIMEGESLTIKERHHQSLTLISSAAMVSGHEYILEVKNLHDCNGILIQEEPVAFTYDIEPPKLLRVASLSAQELKIFYNEAITRSSAESEENYQLDKESGLINSADLADSLSVLLNLKSQLGLDQEYALTVLNAQDESGNISAEETIGFFLDDQLDTLIQSGPTLLDLYFKTEVEKNSAALAINYSLDKNIGHPKSAFKDESNLNLVHLVFDQDFPENTTVTITVENLKDPSGNYINTHKKSFIHDTRALTVTEVEVINDSTIWISFNKPLLSNSALLQANYLVNEDIGSPIEVAIIGPQTVALQFNDKFEEGSTYQLSTIGLIDIYGVKMDHKVNTDFKMELSAPSIEEAMLINPYEIKLKSDRPILLPNDSSITISHHELERITAINAREFVLTSAYTLKENIIHLRLKDLTDLRGNKADSLFIEIPNDSVKLTAATIIKEDLIELTFSAEIAPASAVLPSNYRVNDQPLQEVTLRENQFQVLLRLKQSLSLGEMTAVEVKDINSKEGKESQKILDSIRYEDGVEDMYFLNPQIIQVMHQKPLAKPEAEEAIFTLKDQPAKIQPLVNQTDQRVLQLILDKPIIPDISYDLVIPPRLDTNHEMLSGSTRTIILDQSPPKIVLIEALGENELLISFNEALDPVLSLVTAFYHLNDQEPLEIIPGELPHQIVLVFSEALQAEKTYELKVIEVEDRHHNAIGEEVREFLFDGPILPAFKEVIINEVMPAPKEGNSLPNTEYIELYNTGNDEVSLGGLFLANSRSSTLLPQESIAPGDFLILVPENKQENMEPFGRTIGLSNWPTMLNEGDAIQLLDKKGNILDELNYNTSSFGGPGKFQGGYSLEVVNPFSTCAGSDNLKPSESAQKGTPGKINSVFDDTPDQTPPKLVKIVPKNENYLLIEFSKNLSDNLDLVTITGNPSLEISHITIDGDRPNFLLIQLQEPLVENQLYQISIENLRDCSGNLIDPSSNKSSFKLPVQAEAGDILLNEILFHARTGAPEFVEIYNRSEKFIDLSNWKLANGGVEEVNNRRIIATEDLVIDPFSFMVITSDAAQLHHEYPKGRLETYIQLPDFPGYPNSKGTVILLNSDETLVERFEYDEKYHHGLLKEVKGISLERYSLDHDVNDPENWHSASASEGYATPGYKNSQSYAGSVLQERISISPYVFVPDAAGEQNFTTISYVMENPGYVATIRIHSVNGRLVKELCQNDVWGSSGFYTWDGTDLSGKKVRPGYYIVWVEALNMEGNVENIKKTVVVGAK